MKEAKTNFPSPGCFPGPAQPSHLQNQTPSENAMSRSPTLRTTTFADSKQLETALRSNREALGYER